MKDLFKFPISNRRGYFGPDTVSIIKPLCVTLDLCGEPCLYALVDLNKKDHSNFVIEGFWTGLMDDDVMNKTYLGTLKFSEYIYHFFAHRLEETNEQ